MAVEPSPVLKIPCFVITPHAQNPQFVGREEMFTEIREALAPRKTGSQVQRTFALTGLGGMGKTQIAVEFAFRHQDLFPVILWAHGDSQARLAESFCLFASQLQLGDFPAVKAKQTVQHCLAKLGEFVYRVLLH
jgi:hypothetical protein